MAESTPTTAGEHRRASRRGSRTRIAGTVLVAAGTIAIATSVGMAHADDTTSTTGSTPAATGAVAGSQAGGQIASATDIGLVSITQKTTTGALVENSVIQIERRPDIPEASSTATTSASPTTSAPSTTEPSSTPAAAAGIATTPAGVAVPVGVAFDIITGKQPVILALPAGIYKLTHLGTVGTTNAPNAGDVTIRVAAGQHVAGNLLEQPGTTRGAAPGITAATPTSPTPVPAN